MKQQGRNKRRWLIRCALALILAVAGLASVTAWQIRQPMPLQAERIEAAIAPGTSVRAIAQLWVDAGVKLPPWLLYQWFRWSGKSPLIRAGNYEVTRGMSLQDLLYMMVRGDERLSVVRFIEGWTFRQIRHELAKTTTLQHTLEHLSDAEVMQQLGVAGLSPEGQFFPDSYCFSKGSDDLAVLRRAYLAMQRKVAEVWQKRPHESPLKTPADLLILASIVEKETGRAADRGLIAGVFLNRLRLGMPLQTDPTVIYGLGAQFDGNLRRRDLLQDTPYNTYTRKGLPPTPIAMPGWASLLAAMQPTPTQALYFVARGDGSSEFSDSLRDHNQAVERYQRVPAISKPKSASSLSP